jgi:hypothetical protein
VGDIVFNIAKGKAAYYAGLPASDDALIAVPIETSGIEADATLQDYDTLSALLAAANNEQSTMGRKTLGSVTVTVDDTNNRTDVDAADITWTAASGNAVSGLVICYDPDTTGGTDADLIPLVKLDFVATPDGNDLVFSFNSAGFYRAS